MRAFPKPIRLKCHRPGKNFIYVLSMPVLGNEELTGYYRWHKTAPPKWTPLSRSATRAGGAFVSQTEYKREAW